MNNTATPRVLAILEAFSLERPFVTPEWLAHHLGTSRASIYRDLAALICIGLVERVDSASYTLGPRIVELDRLIRLGDPLIKVSIGLMQELAQEVDGAVLLCRLHGCTVLCIHEVSRQITGLDVSYERGRAMSIYRGATSKAILANLNRNVIDQLIQHQSSEIELGKIGDKEKLLKTIETIRLQGYAVTHGEVDPNAVGVAVPLMNGKRVIGSLSVVRPEVGFSSIEERRSINLLKATVRRIEARLESMVRQKFE